MSGEAECKHAIESWLFTRHRSRSLTLSLSLSHTHTHTHTHSPGHDRGATLHHRPSLTLRRDLAVCAHRCFHVLVRTTRSKRCKQTPTPHAPSSHTTATRRFLHDGSKDLSLKYFPLAEDGGAESGVTGKVRISATFVSQLHKLTPPTFHARTFLSDW